jgi:8-oxo-dGTP pyrophosphatase MutT (NUDIX family)
MSHGNVAGDFERDAGRLSRGGANMGVSAFVELSQLRKVRNCEQVAAVCYRLRNDAVEFLLVRTRGSDRWTFPKGSAERGLTHAQAAALEAFEEAGVHGRIEETAFVRYNSRKRTVGKTSASSGRRELSVNAHLCEVMRLTKPKEMNRDRTWFSPNEAGNRLRKGRRNDEAAEFDRVLEKAVARIQGLLRGSEVVPDQGARVPVNDPLRKVQFEASIEMRGTAWTPAFNAHSRQRLPAQSLLASASPTTSRRILPCDILEFSLAGQRKPPALGSGAKLR